jgi:hypothetical protein
MRKRGLIRRILIFELLDRDERTVRLRSLATRGGKKGELLLVDS